VKRANGANQREPTPRRENTVVPLVPAVVPANRGGGSPGSRSGSRDAVVVPRVPPIGGTGNQKPGNQIPWNPIHSKQKLGNHRCGELVIVALDKWICAISVTCDPWPLSPAGEVQALRAGRRTFQIRQWGVQHRTAYRIAGNPPSATVTVLAEHRCGENVPQAWRQPLPKKPTHNTQEVPF